MGTTSAVTIAEAATILRVSKPRIHQLLQDRTLTGPAAEPGRAPRNALRVWQSSLDAEANRRKAASTTPDASMRAAPSVRSRKTPPPAATASNLANRRANAATPDGADADAARAAAQQMKVALDLARDALRAERTQTRKVTRALADAVALLEDQQRLADQADAVADGYAHALTQLLSPTHPSNA